jgi:DNA-binding transcriptional regulator YdaS (Cro superfamily)
MSILKRDSQGRPKLNDHPLLDYLIAKGWATNDRGLATLLGFSPSTISKVRSGLRVATGDFILAVHDATAIPIKEIRRLAYEI